MNPLPRRDRAAMQVLSGCMENFSISGLGWVWRRAQVSLGELLDVVGNRLGTGHMQRAALSAL